MPPADTSPPKRLVNLIVLHCSATPSGRPLQRGTPGQPGYQNCAQIIDSWHAERGFERSAAARERYNRDLRSIGYHFVVDLDGQVYTGRDVSETGAHAAGFNVTSIGICLVGGAEREGRYTAEQWHSLAQVVTWQAQAHGVPLAPPHRWDEAVWGGVCGHRDLSLDANHDKVITPNEWLKTCPGFDVAAWLALPSSAMQQHLWKDAA